MENDISCCPLCGVEFVRASGSADSRSAAGFKCDNCDKVLEIRVNQFPLA